MEHIVQFAIGVDDERIQKIMEESAAQQVLNDIKEFSHGKKSYYSDTLNSEPVQLREIFAEKISEYVKDHADEVVELAVKEVAQNMMRTKKVKEALNKIAEEISNG